MPVRSLPIPYDRVRWGTSSPSLTLTRAGTSPRMRWWLWYPQSSRETRSVSCKCVCIKTISFHSRWRRPRKLLTSWMLTKMEKFLTPSSSSLWSTKSKAADDLCHNNFDSSFCFVKVLSHQPVPSKIFGTKERKWIVITQNKNTWNPIFLDK